jgi:hypothetical protein
MAASLGPGTVAKRVAAAVIIAAALVTFGLSTHHELQTTEAILSPKFAGAAAETDRQLNCIYDAIRAEVPAGASIYTADNNMFYYQRTEELVTLQAVPTPTKADAKYDVFLYKVRGHCRGLALAVRKT